MALLEEVVEEVVEEEERVVGESATRVPYPAELVSKQKAPVLPVLSFIHRNEIPREPPRAAHSA
jgi:hypothetical protein